jgi:uncharacterized protein
MAGKRQRRMIEGVFVIDATVHGFNFAKDNHKYPFLDDVVRGLHSGGQAMYAAMGTKDYSLTFEQYRDNFHLQPRLMREAMFAESQTDYAVYHGVPMYGLFGDGSSHISVAEKLVAELPHRMSIYADLSPNHPEPEAYIESFKTRSNIIGVKFYPADFVDGHIVEIRMDDEKTVFPLLEKVRAAGIKVVAVHKAVPFGHIPRTAYDVDDMRPAIEAFPDLTFEIVHGGFAFVEETVEMLERYENVVINLESTPIMSLVAPNKFADMMAPFISMGAIDRVYYGTGATAMHPQPILESFWHFQMPRGFPALTPEMKAGVLGANYAKLHGWDIEKMTAACAADAYGLERELQAPWTYVRAEMPAAAA